MKMDKFRVEFAFAENFVSVDEWYAIDGMDSVEAESAEDAAKEVSCTDGLENALFRVYKLVPDEFGGFGKSGEPEYFNF